MLHGQFELNKPDKVNKKTARIISSLAKSLSSPFLEAYME